MPAQPALEQLEQLKDVSSPITIHLSQKLPKDRPFANIVEFKHTTAAPQHLQRIMDMKGTNAADKSARLKMALRRDNQMLVAYCILLAGKVFPLAIPLDSSLPVESLTPICNVAFSYGIACLLSTNRR